jgi:hypothetical protein
MSQANDVDLWSLADLSTPWCVHVVATLRVAEHVAEGRTRIDDLARAAGAHAESLWRVLRHLVSKGVFEEPEPGQFALNDPARGLLEPGVHLGLDLDSFGGRGRARHAGSGGAPERGLGVGPHGRGRRRGQGMAARRGAAREAARAGRARRPAADRGARGGGSQHRWRRRPRDRGGPELLRSPAPGADLYLLKNVLADWPDPEALALLRRCAEAAASDEGDGPIPALLMMVLAGGKERSLSEFRELARSAGLEVAASFRQASGRFVVECRPAP